MGGGRVVNPKCRRRSQFVSVPIARHHGPFHAVNSMQRHSVPHGGSVRAAWEGRSQRRDTDEKQCFVFSGVHAVSSPSVVNPH